MAENVTVSESAVWDALAKVTDPEIGMDVVNLGLIYGVTITDATVSVDMTLTTIGCPAADLLEEDVKREVGEVEGVMEVSVDFTFDPPWSPARITEEGRDQLLAMGVL